jgi:hypothetical protein
MKEEIENGFERIETNLNFDMFLLEPVCGISLYVRNSTLIGLLCLELLLFRSVCGHFLLDALVADLVVLARLCIALITRLQAASGTEDSVV